MFNPAILKQDFRINKKLLAICFAAQFFSLLLASVIRGMKLIDISDIFWDTIPVVIIPMAMQIALAYMLVKRCEDERTMTIILSTAIRPEEAITTKALFMVMSNFLLFGASMFYGCLTHVYDLTRVWNSSTYIALNLGGMCLQLFVGGWCYLMCCVSKSVQPLFYWLAGAGVPVLCYGIYLLYYLVEPLFFLQYLTPFGMFRQEWFASGSMLAVAGSILFAALGIVCFGFGRYAFVRRSLRV